MKCAFTLKHQWGGVKGCSLTLLWGFEWVCCFIHSGADWWQSVIEVE